MQTQSLGSKICAAALVVAGLFTAAGAMAAEEKSGPYSVSAVWHLGGPGRWDDLTVDSAAGLLYVSRQTHVQVVSTKDGKVVADLQGMRGNHAIALVPQAGRGFVTDGQANAVVVFDLKTFKELGRVPTGQKPDLILYDSASRHVFAFDGGSKDATVIDPAADPGTGAVVGHIPLGGKPEFPVSDEHGKIYVNLEDQSSIAQIDSASMKVVATWKIEGGEGPSGLAIDAAHHRLFAGCDNKVMAIVDAESGKTLGTIPIGENVDGCRFDPATGEAFASCGDGTLTIVKQGSDGKFVVEQTLQTKRGAKTMALDPVTHTIYLPTAEFEAAAPGVKRPPARPDTFMLLVVTRSQQ